MSADVIVGLDLGTSGLKAVAVDANGAVVARAQRRYPTERPEPGASEQNPADWIEAVHGVVSELRNSTASHEWSALGLSGMLPTLVTLDHADAAMGRAITWEDARADDFGDALRDSVGADALYAMTGQWVDGRYLLPMLARIAHVDANRAAHTRTLMGAKDFVLHWLTGELVTDPSTAAGFGCYDLARGMWDEAVRSLAADQSGGLRPALPRVAPSLSTLPLSPRAAESLHLPAGLPVCVGAADSVLGAVGLGIAGSGQVAYIAGTSTIVLGIADRPLLDREHRWLVTPMERDGRYGLEMDLLSTGSSVRWLAALLGVADEAALLQLAAGSASDAGPVFLPYLAPGEQGALWDSELSGTLLGLTLGHSAADVARALVDGIVAESRRCVAALRDVGAAGDTISASGGSAADPWFRQQLADATGCQVVMPPGDDVDGSALGAALLAAESVGWNLPSTGVSGTPITPDADGVARWEQVARRHDAALAAVRGLS